jgi:hypothetical protein
MRADAIGSLALLRSIEHVVRDGTIVVSVASTDQPRMQEQENATDEHIVGYPDPRPARGHGEELTGPVDSGRRESHATTPSVRIRQEGT